MKWADRKHDLNTFETSFWMPDLLSSASMS